MTLNGGSEHAAAGLHPRAGVCTPVVAAVAPHTIGRPYTAVAGLVRERARAWPEQIRCTELLSMGRIAAMRRPQRRSLLAAASRRGSGGRLGVSGAGRVLAAAGAFARAAPAARRRARPLSRTRPPSVARGSEHHPRFRQDVAAHLPVVRSLMGRLRTALHAIASAFATEYARTPGLLKTLDAVTCCTLAAALGQARAACPDGRTRAGERTQRASSCRVAAPARGRACDRATSQAVLYLLVGGYAFHVFAAGALGSAGLAALTGVSRRRAVPPATAHRPPSAPAASCL